MAWTTLLRVVAAAGLTGTLACTLPAAAELAELPLHLPFDVDSVVIGLWSADVDVDVDPESESLLRATAVDEESGPVDLEVAFEGETLYVRRPAGTEGPPVRIRVEVAVTPSQAVNVEGRDLAVTVRSALTAEEQASADEEQASANELSTDIRQLTRRLSPIGEPPAAGAESVPTIPGYEDPSPADAPPASPTILQFALDGSQVDFAGTRNAVVEATRTSVWMTRTSGSFAVTLDRGSAEIRGHQGDLELDATASEVSAYDLRGKLRPRLVGGSLDVRQGTGVFDGIVSDAVVVFDGWLGYVTLRGDGATVEGREVDMPRPWNLDGTDLLVSLEAIAGPVTAVLHGGRFKAASMDGRLAVTADHSADVELERLRRGADLKLSGGATARLTDVSGQIKVELYDAELSALRAGNLILSGARSTVDVAEVERLAQVEMTDSNLILDLTSSANSAFLKLLGTGRTVARLAAPCTVRITGPAADGSAVDVSGCDLHLPGQPDRSVGGRLVYGERRLVTLTVALDEGVELEVEGLP